MFLKFSAMFTVKQKFIGVFSVILLANLVIGCERADRTDAIEDNSSFSGKSENLETCEDAETSAVPQIDLMYSDYFATVNKKQPLVVYLLDPEVEAPAGPKYLVVDRYTGLTFEQVLNLKTILS